MRPTKATAWRFLKEHSTAILATSSDGGPYTSPIFYKLTPDKTLCFVTGSRTSKHQNISKDSRVALSIVDSEKPEAVNVSGKAHLVTDPDNELRLFRMIGQIEFDFDHPSTKHRKGDFVAVEVTLERIQYTDYSKKMDSNGSHIFDL